MSESDPRVKNKNNEKEFKIIHTILKRLNMLISIDELYPLSENKFVPKNRNKFPQPCLKLIKNRHGY
jgi:hypothetical protein